MTNTWYSAVIQYLLQTTQILIFFYFYSDYTNVMMKLFCFMSSSYSTIVLYSRDHQGLGVAYEKYHPKTSLISLTRRCGSIG